LKPLSCTKDHYLFKEGEIADKVFIIKNGEFIITKKQISKNKQTENVTEILENPQRACVL
jgi:CRP-like cAMP-binding protein